jgi:predicted DNA-binding transcriptional regulator YafY
MDASMRESIVEPGPDGFLSAGRSCASLSGMAHDEDKLIRQLSLLSFLLSSRRPFTAREVQESVEGYAEMSDDTFARRFHGDRADLAKIGIDVRVVGGAENVGSADGQLYCLSEEDFRLPAVEFTSAEASALSVALAALDGRFAYARPLRLALTAILRGNPGESLVELQQLPVALAPDEDAARAGKQLSRLEQAVTRGKTVCFPYPSKEGAPRDRTVDPYSLYLIQGHWYVVGHDHLRGAIRTFRVGRIAGVVRFATEKVRDFAVPSDYDPATYRARPPWLIGQRSGQATVRVRSDLAWWVDRLQPHVTALEEDEAGAPFVMPYADESLLLSWVAGLADAAEVLEPGRLRARMAKVLESIAAAHAGSGRSDLDQFFQSRRKRTPARREASPVAPEHLARAIALLTYLLDEHRPAFVPWSVLQQDLGLSRSEVEGDLSLINLVNFGGGTYALTAEARADGVRVWRDVMAESFAKPARLSPIMARALLLALDLLGDTLAVPGLESLASVRRKVGTLIDAAGAEGRVIVDELVPPSPDVVEVLNRAMRDHSVVVLDYFTPSRGELAERRVEPYLLFHSSDGWYLEAFCLRAMAQRTFKLERIRGAQLAGGTFVPRPEVDLGQRRTGAPFCSPATTSQAVVRLLSRWQSYLDERGIESHPVADGEIVARVPYLDERWMVLEILRYLGEAVLEQPSSARERVHALATALAARYAGERQIQSSQGDGR